MGRRTGRPTGRPPKPADERFWSMVIRDPDSECWFWTAHIQRNGYARFQGNEIGVTVLAHRFAYELLVGPIQEGLQLDHLCRNRHCVNPAHLEPVTCRENLIRGVGFAARNAAKTHCKRGHPLRGEDADVYVHDGMTRCRPCQNIREREGRLRAKSAA